MKTNINSHAKKVAVTGGAGFIGSNIVDELVSRGYEVHVVDNLIAGSKENVHKDAVLHVVDIRDTEKLTEILKDVSFVFHLAALPGVPYSIENPIETTEVNLGGTVNVLVAARDAKADRVIFSSSAAVYGDADVLPVHEGLPLRPNSPYGLQKLESELNCALFSDIYGLKTVSLRYFNVYGPGQKPDGPYASAIPKFIQKRINNEPIPIFGSGEQTRDFVNVKDVVEANIRTLLSERVGKGEVINIGTGQGSSVNSIAKIIGGAVEYFPERKEIKHSISDVTRARELLGWEPAVTIEKGLKELLEAN